MIRRSVGTALLVILVVFQFFRPEKNLGETNTPGDFVQSANMPDTLARIFLNSCYDCHSNHTNYPWYSQIAPASWYLHKHVVEGKEAMNFSAWGSLGDAEKVSFLSDICDECTKGAMPLPSYILVHRSARLSPAEIDAICGWTETEAMKILISGEGP